MNKYHTQFKSDTGTIYIRRFPKTLHDLLKVYCFKRGKTIKQVIIHIVEEMLKDEVLSDRQRNYKKRVKRKGLRERLEKEKNKD